MPSLIIASIIGAAFFFSLLLPLFTYSTALAVFGFAHVVFEMRYLQRRFQSTISRGFLIYSGILLVLIALLRILLISDSIESFLGLKLELGLVASLCLPGFFIAKDIWTKNPSKNKLAMIVFSIIIYVAFALGIVFSPTLILLGFALFHNFTPLVFITEACPRGQRIPLLSATLFVFIILPLLMVLGPPAIPQFEWSILPTGPLMNHLSVYIPAALHQQPWAERAFSAFVFAQCMHYGATIYLYPRFQLFHNGDRLWTNKYSLIIVLVLCCLTTLPFFQNFYNARSFYGIFAALHAWIEIPLILCILGGLKGKPTQTQSEGQAVGNYRNNQSLNAI